MKTTTIRSNVTTIMWLVFLTILAIAVPRTGHAAVEITNDGTCLVSGQDAYGAYMPQGHAINPCDAKRAEMTCVVSGIDAYAHYMKHGYGVKRCVPGIAPTAEMIRRATCPEMWGTVTNVSDPRCRAENDRRNIRHDPPPSPE